MGDSLCPSCRRGADHPCVGSSYPGLGAVPALFSGRYHFGAVAHRGRTAVAGACLELRRDRH